MKKPKKYDYSVRAIAFLDILGFSSLTKQLDVDDSKYSQLIYALNKIKEYQKLLTIPHSMTLNLEVSIFSDSIAISGKPEDLFNILWSCGYLFSDLLSNGIVLRGGVTLGKLHHQDGIIFGQGLVDAYLLESTTANYPRILLSNESVEQLPDIVTNYIQKDNDGLYCLNTFEFHSVIPGATELAAAGSL